MITSVGIGDEVLTTKEQFGVPVGTRATIKEICWINLESASDVMFCVGLVFPDHIYDDCGLSKEAPWGYYSTEIEYVKEEK